MSRTPNASLPWLALVIVVHSSSARSDEGSRPSAKAPATAPASRLELPPPTKYVPGVVIRKDLEYGSGSGRALHLDLYSPEKAPKKSDGPLPFVLWIHGGGWVAGDKNPCGVVGLVPKGFVTASVEYRFSPEAIFPAQIEDCKAAVRWVRANAEALGIDPERIGAAGASAGGHLAALLGVAGDAADLEGAGGCSGVSSAIGAVCDIYGPTDFLKFDGHGSVIVAEDDQSVIAQLLGGSLATHRQLATKASPISYVTKDDPPFFIVHGDKDNVVPLDQSRIFDAALSKAGVDSTLVVVKGGGHGGLPPDVNARIVEFFETKLKPRKTKRAATGSSGSTSPTAGGMPSVPPAASPVPVEPAMAEGR